MAAIYEQRRVSSLAGMQNYLVAGGGPPLVFLHGLGAYAATWSSTIERFSSCYRVIAIDLAGHGASDPADGPITFELVLDGLTSVLELESQPIDGQSPSPYVLVGHSMGAWISCLYTLTHPNRVERLVLVNGPPLEALPPGVTLQPGNRKEALRLFAASRGALVPQLDDSFLDAYIEYANTGPISRLNRDERHAAPYRLEGRLQDFPRPVDLLWGREDRLVPYSTAETLLRELPAVRLTELAGCGHVPQADCKEAFLAGLAQILSTEPPRHKSTPH